MCTRLPQELWHLIVESGTWSRSEIRTLRLTSKEISQSATPLLFSSILLRPNTGSLERAQQVASASHLAHHVRKLHMRPDVVGQNLQTAKHFIIKLEGFNLPEYDVAALSQIVIQSVDRRAAIAVQQYAYREIDSFKAISAICQRLPNLSALDFSMEPDLNSEFSKTYGFAPPDPDNGHDALHQLQLCNIVKPTSVQIPMLKWQVFFEFPGSGAVVNEDWFSGLRTVEVLDVRITDSGPLDYPAKQMESFKAFWQHASNVEELSIGFFRCTRRNPTTLSNDLMLPLLSTSWPKLRKLELVNLYVTQSDLHDFLYSHRQTLRQLCLRNITFKDHLDEDWPAFGRILETFIFLRNTMQLERFGLKEYVGTDFIDLFYATNFDCPNTYLKQIQEFVCRRGDFPFPLVLEYTKSNLDLYGSDSIRRDPQYPEYDSDIARREACWAYERTMTDNYQDASWLCCDDDEDSEFDEESDASIYSTTDEESGPGGHWVP